MAHVVLILPTATYRAHDFVEAAARLGADITLASEDRPPLAEGARTPTVIIDCDSPEESAARIIAHADHHPIDAIVAADDQGVEIAALAAEALGLPHNQPFGVAATRNKVMLRRALARAEVPQPAFGVVNTAAEAESAVADLGAPAVLKPLGLSASQGVIRVNDPSEAPAAAERIRRILITEGRSPGEPILVERFVPGIEVALEGLLLDGRLEVLATFDKPDPLDGPYFEETMLITPSRLHPEMLEEVVRVTERAIAALDLSEGPIHAELRVDGPRVILLEVAARSVGGLCGRSLRFGLLGGEPHSPPISGNARVRSTKGADGFRGDDAADTRRGNSAISRRSGRGASGPGSHRSRDIDSSRRDDPHAARGQPVPGIPVRQRRHPAGS
jgi:formate-dependent phosphoribosylglycinamide formyltransferase (GAR transformylase)